MLDMSKLELSEKDRNQLQILDELISHEKVSASDIVSKIGISAATISRVFRNLKDKELIKYLGRFCQLESAGFWSIKNISTNKFTIRIAAP